MRCSLLLGYLTVATAFGATHDDSFSKEGLFKADVNELKDTRLEAHPDLPLDPKVNTLWCGTLQLAWNEAVSLVGEKLDFQPPSGPSVPPASEKEIDFLNRQEFQARDLAPGSYVALADFERNQVEARIRAALANVFQGAASPELIPPTPRNPGPDDFVAYAYLYKNLAFAVPFGAIPSQRFGDRDVQAFGFNQDMHLPAQPQGQVLIYDYKSSDDFVIELKSKSTDDQLILAKIAPGASLGATAAETLRRMKLSLPEAAGPGDALSIPKLNFDLRKDFRELEGLTLQPGPSTKIHLPLSLTKVEQLVRFQLNEKGAILKSEAVIVARALAMMSRHQMIFDRPFLLMMKQKNFNAPYLELWIANTTLLIPSARAPGT